MFFSAESFIYKKFMKKDDRREAQEKRRGKDNGIETGGKRQRERDRRGKREEQIEGRNRGGAVEGKRQRRDGGKGYRRSDTGIYRYELEQEHEH